MIIKEIIRIAGAEEGTRHLDSLGIPREPWAYVHVFQGQLLWRFHLMGYQLSLYEVELSPYGSTHTSAYLRNFSQVFCEQKSPNRFERCTT